MVVMKSYVHTTKFWQIDVSVEKKSSYPSILLAISFMMDHVYFRNDTKDTFEFKHDCHW